MEESGVRSLNREVMEVKVVEEIMVEVKVVEENMREENMRKVKVVEDNMRLRSSLMECRLLVQQQVGQKAGIGVQGWVLVCGDGGSDVGMVCF